MSINLKNPETSRAIRELAELTGEGQTEAVTIAVKARIDAIRRERGHGRFDRIMAISKITGPLLKDLPDHGDFLYDKETGLPK